MKRCKTLVVCVLSAFLVACSNTFIYNQLDWLIPWYIDDYVDLTRDQKRTLKPRLEELLRWHRGEELAGYLVILDRIEADLALPVSGDQVEQWANLMLAAYERIEEKMLPLAFELGRSLTDEQMDEFLASLREQQEELEEEYLERSDEEYVEDNRERFTENIRDFLGRPTPEQLAVVEAAVMSLQRFDSAWLEERSQWISTLSGLLQRRPGWEEEIVTALAERERNRTQAYRDAYANNAVIINNTIAELLNLRSERQAARLREEIDDFRRDLTKLIEQGEREAQSS